MEQSRWIRADGARWGRWSRADGAEQMEQSEQSRWSRAEQSRADGAEQMGQSTWSRAEQMEQSRWSRAHGSDGAELLRMNAAGSNSRADGGRCLKDGVCSEIAALTLILWTMAVAWALLWTAARWSHRSRRRRPNKRPPHDDAIPLLMMCSSCVAVGRYLNVSALCMTWAIFDGCDSQSSPAPAVVGPARTRRALLRGVFVRMTDDGEWCLC